MEERLRCNDCHHIRHAGAALGRRLMIIPLWEKAPSPPLVFTDYIFLTHSFSPSVGIRSSKELHPEYAISKALVCISVWNVRVGDLSTWCHVKHQLGSKARQGLQTSTTSLAPPSTLLNVLVCQHGNYFSFISRRLIVVRNLWSLGQFGVYGAKEHQILAIIKNHKKKSSPLLPVDKRGGKLKIVTGKMNNFIWVKRCNCTLGTHAILLMESIFL